MCNICSVLRLFMSMRMCANASCVQIVCSVFVCVCVCVFVLPLAVFRCVDSPVPLLHDCESDSLRRLAYGEAALGDC